MEQDPPEMCIDEKAFVEEMYKAEEPEALEEPLDEPMEETVEGTTGYPAEGSQAEEEYQQEEECCQQDVPDYPQDDTDSPQEAADNPQEEESLEDILRKISDFEEACRKIATGGAETTAEGQEERGNVERKVCKTDHWGSKEESPACLLPGRRGGCLHHPLRRIRTV